MSAPTPPADPDLDRVRRAFDAIFWRMVGSPTVADLDGELSNLLHQLYRLGELCRRRLAPAGAQLTPKAFGALLSTSTDLRAARAALWTRTFDTHDLAAADLSAPADTYSDRYGDIYGAVTWKPLPQADPDGRHLDYATELEGRPVLDTMRRAFDALAALLR